MTNMTVRGIIRQIWS